MGRDIKAARTVIVRVSFFINSGNQNMMNKTPIGGFGLLCAQCSRIRRKATNAGKRSAPTD